MTNDEIKFFKHCLQSYNYYWKHYLDLHDVQESLEEQRLALATKTSSVLKKPEKNSEPVDLYSSDEWQAIVRLQKDCRKERYFFWHAIKYTEGLLDDISDDTIRAMLRELYISKIPRGQIRQKHFFADDKAMYRAIRSYLKKHKMTLPIQVRG